MEFLECDQKLIIDGLKQAIANVLLEEDINLLFSFRLENNNLILIANKEESVLGGKVYELGRLCNQRKQCIKK